LMRSTSQEVHPIFKIKTMRFVTPQDGSHCAT
jgi:hypothetical protein